MAGKLRAYSLSWERRQVPTHVLYKLHFVLLVNTVNTINISSVRSKDHRKPAKVFTRRIFSNLANFPVFTVFYVFFLPHLSTSQIRNNL